jgi:hypothetical protein
MKKLLLWVGLGWLALFILLSIDRVFSAYLQGRGVAVEIADFLGAVVLYGGTSFVIYWLLLSIFDFSGFSPRTKKVLQLLFYFDAFCIAQVPLINFMLRQMDLQNTFWGAFFESSLVLLGFGVIAPIVWWARKKQSEQRDV